MKALYIFKGAEIITLSRRALQYSFLTVEPAFARVHSRPVKALAQLPPKGQQTWCTPCIDLTHSTPHSDSNRWLAHHYCTQQQISQLLQHTATLWRQPS